MRRAARPPLLLQVGRRLQAAPSGRARSICSSIDIAVEADFKSNSVLPAGEEEEGSVRFAARKTEWKPRAAQPQGVAVEASQLFAASNNPLEHTADDVGKFFHLDGSTSAFHEVFYHTGFCGDRFAARAQKLKSSATMVRAEGVALRDELLGLERDGKLAEGGDDDASSPGGLVLAGEAGVGKSMVMDYALTCLHEAGWLVAVMPHAADWTHGVSARTAQDPNEAYRVTDPAYFSEPPPELVAAAEVAMGGDGKSGHLYEAPDASANFLISFYLSQRSKLATIPIKGDERKAFYASAASDAAVGPTLADMLAGYVRDASNGFNDFPMMMRPIYDLLAELQLVTEYPTAVVVDGWNVWDGMASSCQWQSRIPLHSSQLVVPSLLGTDLSYGKKMQRGLMLCGLSHGGIKPTGTPKRLRKHFPPKRDWLNVPAPGQPKRPPYSKHRREEEVLPPQLEAALRHVSPYSVAEVARSLDYYALVGQVQNSGLDTQLRTGAAAEKVKLLSGGVAEDVYKIGEQM